MFNQKNTPSIKKLTSMSLKSKRENLSQFLKVFKKKLESPKDLFKFLDLLFINNQLFNLLSIKRRSNSKLSMDQKDMLKDNLEYCLLNSTKLLEYKRKLFLDQLSINNTLSNLLSLQRILKLNIKIKNLFTELLLLSTMPQLPILLLKERPMIEPSRFQFSMMLE